ncbi:uridine kinase [Salinibacterium sp. CAN_S4]|uniref:ATP-binding protein n=1 Tax=Salinibacterium sp. CAN_S4 TaxID=2787727 RepID=UPI0018EF56AD
MSGSDAAGTARARRILIDGRSGSGKTELARALVDGWPGCQLVRLDDLYPGWDGLDAGSRAVASILTTARWRAWDWAAGVPGARHELDASAPIVIEGVGAISRSSLALADVAVWVDLDDATRKSRALNRDGDAYAPFWDRWAQQEERFMARENPRALASMLVDGRDTAAILGNVSRAARS